MTGQNKPSPHHSLPLDQIECDKANSDRVVQSLSHQSLKTKGNRFLTNGCYREAFKCYSLAIDKQPDVSIYHSNRAMALFNLKDFSASLANCRRAIELDPGNVKAHFFSGLAHLELQHCDEAITSLLHAHSLALEQGRDFGDEITSVVRRAKRRRFELNDAKRRGEEIELQTYLTKAIRQEGDRQKHLLLASSHSNRKLSSSGQIVTNAIVNSAPSSTPDSPSSCVNTTDAGKTLPIDISVAQLSLIDTETERQITELNALFLQVDSRRQRREVPETLCGRISFEVMRDPVITPSGITYDRQCIIAHLRKVGHFDPLTRTRLLPNQLIPNLVMKEVVHNFLHDNPWAESF